MGNGALAIGPKLPRPSSTLPQQAFGPAIAIADPANTTPGGYVNAHAVKMGAAPVAADRDATNRFSALARFTEVAPPPR
jgi:hypothetical protein